MIDMHFVNWQIANVTDADLFRALGNDRRLQILAWLKEPTAHFPPQRDGDLIEDGVCGQLIAEKLGINASTLSEHMRVLQGCGLVTGKRIKQWTFYRRDSERFRVITSIVDGI